MAITYFIFNLKKYYMNIFHNYETTQKDFLEDKSRIKFPQTWKSVSDHSKLQKLVYFCLALKRDIYFQNKLLNKKNQ